MCPAFLPYTSSKAKAYYMYTNKKWHNPTSINQNNTETLKRKSMEPNLTDDNPPDSHHCRTKWSHYAVQGIHPHELTKYDS